MVALLHQSLPTINLWDFTKRGSETDCEVDSEMQIEIKYGG